jgi:hypothetical protein
MTVNRYLRRKEAAAYLKENFGVGSVALLAQAAMKGTGPVMTYFGAVPLYHVDTLHEWAISRLSAPVLHSKPRPRRPEETPGASAE